MHDQSNVTRRTIDLSYDPINQLHHLPFDALVPAAGDLFLALRPQADGVIEGSALVAIKNTFVSANDIKRVLRIAVSTHHKPKDGIVTLLLPGTRFAIRIHGHVDRKSERESDVQSYCYSTGTSLPLGFPGESLTATVRYILLPSWVLPRLTVIYAEWGVNLAGVAILEPDGH